MKLLYVEDDVHADLLLLKSIHGHKNMSETIRYEMALAKHDAQFFDRMRDLGVERT